MTLGRPTCPRGLLQRLVRRDYVPGRSVAAKSTAPQEGQRYAVIRYGPPSPSHRDRLLPATVGENRCHHGDRVVLRSAPGTIVTWHRVQDRVWSFITSLPSVAERPSSAAGAAAEPSAPIDRDAAPVGCSALFGSSCITAARSRAGHKTPGTHTMNSDRSLWGCCAPIGPWFLSRRTSGAGPPPNYWPRSRREPGRVQTLGPFGPCISGTSSVPEEAPGAAPSSSSTPPGPASS